MMGPFLEEWSKASGRSEAEPGEIAAAVAVLPLVAQAGAMPPAAALSTLYTLPLLSEAVRRADLHAAAEALQWEGHDVEVSPGELHARAFEYAYTTGEPVRTAIGDTGGLETDEIPDKVLTADGWMDFDGEYVPRVVTAENGRAAGEALKAQAVAARTYVLRAMRDHKALGRTVAIGNTQKFQVYSRKGALPVCIDAANGTRGIVARHAGRLILANYVAGALWTAKARPGTDPTNTEKWVTYNEGRMGADVRPTKLSDTGHPGNRGCKSQNGADWLARNGYGYEAILRFFYGADLELGVMSGVSRTNTNTNAPTAAAGGGGALVALAAGAWVLTR